MSAPSIENGDKFQHLIGYSILALLAQLIWKRPARVWLFASLMGIAIEFAQALTPYRSFDTHDMLANSIGALVGVLLGLAINAGGFNESVQRKTARAIKRSQG